LFGAIALPSTAHSPGEADGIWRGIWLEEAHHSTAIEGNTLVLKQVEQLLEEGRAVGNKDLREYLEVRGYADRQLGSTCCSSGSAIPPRSSSREIAGDT